MEKHTFLLLFVLIWTIKITFVVNAEKAFRNDLRCGPDNLINGKAAICDPNGENPCCSPNGWCGKTHGHCLCDGCIDYSKVRTDLRCGPDYPINEKPAICDRKSANPCCAPNGWCGITHGHCHCDGCIDYSKVRTDLRCGPFFRVNMRISICDPYGEYPCCAPNGWCGKTQDHCDCDRCIDYSKDKRTLEELFEEM